MRVSQIVGASRWRPPRETKRQPLVSVLFGVAGGARADHVEQSVRSVLTQTEARLELLVVDDSGAPEVSSRLSSVAAVDPRVGVIRHPHVIGLRAVGLFEGLSRSRGEYLAFGFEGDLFQRELLEALLDQARRTGAPFLHGRARIPTTDREGCWSPLARQGLRLPQAMLRGVNGIACQSVLLHRRVVEDVGFFDPHVAVADCAHWDLWRRAAERFELVPVDVEVGTIAARDGIDGWSGDEWPADPWLAAEWMSLPRREALGPASYPSRDVLERPKALDASAAAAIAERGRILERRLTGRLTDLTGLDAASITRRARGGSHHRCRLLVVTAAHDASTTLCFDRLPAVPGRSVRVVYPGHHRPEVMLGADVVIFVRYPFDCRDPLAPRDLPFGAWVETARKEEIPHYYFLDDNLMALGREARYRAAWGAFTEGRLKGELRSFAGVLLSSQPLVEYFRQREMHDRLYYFPPIAGAPRHTPEQVSPERGALRVAYFSGTHRLDRMKEVVWPALRALARTGPIEVGAVLPREEAAELGRDADRSEGLRLTCLPSDVSLDLGLRRLAALSPHVLVHPGSGTVNARFKTLNALLNAHSLGAVPLVSREPPFEQVAEYGAALVIPDETRAWESALARVWSSPEVRQRIRERLALLCARDFDGSANARALREIAARPDTHQRMQRRRDGEGPGHRDPRSGEADGPGWIDLVGEAAGAWPMHGEAAICRVAVPEDGLCGIDLDTPGPATGATVSLRVLSVRGQVLREATTSVDQSGGMVSLRFPPIRNSRGQLLRFELRSVEAGPSSGIPTDRPPAPAAESQPAPRGRRLWFAV